MLRYECSRAQHNNKNVRRKKMGQPQIILNASRACLIQNEKSEANFENAVGRAIDEVLSGLGDGNKQAFYCYLRNNYGINEDEIPYKIEDFARAIEQIFGSAAKLIEIKIIERLHLRYKDFFYVPEKGELNFVDFEYNLRHHLRLKA